MLFGALLLTGGLGTPNSAYAQASEARLLRFPAIHGDRVVFSYAGDLYTVPRSGGTARRLTNHVGYEMFARFSPDGKYIAYSAQYDGNTEVYVMPASGGVPRRLTHTATLSRDEVSDRMGPNNVVMAWTPDSKHIIYRTRAVSFNDFKGKLFKVPLEGGPSDTLPFSVGGFCSYSPDGKKLAYNRVFREFRTWKYYRGGMADDVWVFDFATGRTEAICQTTAQDIFPMWAGDEILYISDRDRTMNLFSYNTKTKQTTKLTEFSDFDIKFPSHSQDAVVFEKGGFLWIYDLKTRQASKLTIRIENDLPSGRPTLMDAAKHIYGSDLAPNGSRLLLSARGEVFSVAHPEGPTRNLSRTSGVHERGAKFSPDGKQVAFISDASGEDEIYVQPADGSGKPRRITTTDPKYKYDLAWSPDGQKIAWTDKALRLRYVEVENGRVVEVDRAEAWEIRQFEWSPDSRWIAYVRPEWQTTARICLYSLDSKKSTPVTERWFSAYNPYFSPDGQYLFFTSQRDFNPIYSQTEWNHAYINMSRVHFILLNKDAKDPFAPKNKEASEQADNPEADKDKDTNAKKSPPSVRVDFEGIEGRVRGLPIAASNYYGLQASAKGLIFYIESKSGGSGPVLKVYDLNERKETVLLEGVNGVQLARNEQFLYLSKGGKHHIVPLGKLTKGEAIKLDPGNPVNLDGLKVLTDLQAEWAQIFRDCWRQMRDFHYAPNMHGINWEAMREKYEPLLPHVAHRADLSYIIGELIGEINVGHAYIGGGDLPEVPRIPMGLLGAVIDRPAKNGPFRVRKVLQGASWSKPLRAPLADPSVNVQAGDFILAINGRPAAELTDLYEALIDQVDKAVELVVAKNADGKDRRTVIVYPIADESELYYQDWVRGNIAKVEKATNGRVGYVHIPNMVEEGLNEFVKYFYPQLNKEGLIIDVRGNGGGNVSPMILERLRRELDMVLMSRDVRPTPSPREIVWGPKVALCDGWTASDGDLFSYRFKKYGLGTLIGKRTWGGTVGIRGPLPTIDGADLRKPEFSRYDLDGREWIIESHGVDPDIVVDNDPHREFLGYDDQLDEGIKVILEQLKTQYRPLPPVPPFPQR